MNECVEWKRLGGQIVIVFGSKSVPLGLKARPFCALNIRAEALTYRNATLGLPALTRKTGIPVKTLHPIFGPRGNPTAANLFNIIACLQEHEGVRLQVVA